MRDLPATLLLIVLGFGPLLLALRRWERTR